MAASIALLPAELDAEVMELLPARETLFIDINIAPVTAINLSFAINAATIGSVANSAALQEVMVLQR